MSLSPAPPKRSASASMQKTGFGLGALINAVAVATFTGDWACGIVGAALIGAAIGWFIAAVLSAVMLRRLSIIVAVVIVTVSLAGAQVFWKRATLPRQAFEHAFGVAPSSAIADLRVHRHYAGGPGDTVTLIRFRTDSATIQTLLVSPRFERVDTWDDDFAGGRMHAAEYWRKAFSNLADQYHHNWWPTENPPLAKPRTYRVEHARADETTVIWDESTGDVYVLSSFG